MISLLSLFLHSFVGAAAEALTMTSLLATVTEIFTAVIGYVSTVASTIAENPLLLIFCVIPLIGLGVGLFRRLLNVQ